MEPSTGAVAAIVTIINALAVATNLYDHPMSSFQNGIIRPRLFRAVITMLSIRKRAPTITQPRFGPGESGFLGILADN